MRPLPVDFGVRTLHDELGDSKRLSLKMLWFCMARETWRSIKKLKPAHSGCPGSSIVGVHDHSARHSERLKGGRGREGKWPACSQVLHKGFKPFVKSSHLASLGEAWWLRPKVGDAGQTGDARQLLLLMGDEGIWIQFKNYGTLNIKLRLIHLDSCSVTSSQTSFYCWQPSSWNNTNHESWRNSQPVPLLELLLAVGDISFHLPHQLPLSSSPPWTGASWRSVNPAFSSISKVNLCKLCHCACDVGWT